MINLPIPRPDILKWHASKQFTFAWQSEQDMLISRILIEIFKNDALKSVLAFKGGTALYKLHYKEPVRYSEDIDFVTIDEEANRNIVLSMITEILEDVERHN